MPSEPRELTHEEKKVKLSAIYKKKKPLTAAQIRKASQVLLAGLALCLAGCSSLQARYVEAQIAFEAAIGPEYSAYVQADEALDDEQKALRAETVRRWRAANAVALEETR